MTLFHSKALRPSDISVLVVDDEPDIRRVVRVSLEDFGFIEVREAASGEEALNLAHRYSPQLIVLDYMMPIMDGEAVARTLRMLTPDVVIVAFSGVLRYKPDWADEFVDKLEISEVARVGFELVELRSRLSVSVKRGSRKKPARADHY